MISCVRIIKILHKLKHIKKTQAIRYCFRLSVLNASASVCCPVGLGQAEQSRIGSLCCNLQINKAQISSFSVRPAYRSTVMCTCLYDTTAAGVHVVYLITWQRLSKQLMWQLTCAPLFDIE